ncbi:MAG TPA: hypothetical protein VNH44_19615 [Micropepsaceae bacterium]|nr:hypothetical protein [Micropepsaceae bacterium]
MKDRLLDVLKGAVEVNLRYSSIALNLSKEYIKEFDRALRDGAAAKPTPSAEAAPEARPAPPRRQPILLVGQLNEEASGAFVLNNTSATELNVNLVVQGELEPSQVQLVPSTFVLAAGATAVVRLKVNLTGALEMGRDYSGAVIAPGMSAQAIEFVVRRLPGEAAAKTAKKKRKASASRAAG